MSGALARSATIAWHEFRTAWRRVSTWVLVAILLLFAWGFVAGNVVIGTGSSAVGGERPHLNSMFNVANTQIVIFALFYIFFAAIGFGMSVLEDDNARVGPLVHATPLSPREYIWSRFFGQLAAYLVIIATQVVLLAVFMQLYPVEEPEKVRGAFHVANYVWPTFLFVVLPVVCFGGVSFALGSITRQSVLVFLLPVATLLTCVFFLWSFSPEWLAPWQNRALQALDPTGMRWIRETYFRVDRGASYYNTMPIELDALFIANRVGLLVVGFGSVALAAFFERRRLRGAYRMGPATITAVIEASDRVDALQREQRHAPTAATAAMPKSTHALPTAMRTFRATLAAEARELRGAPGLMLFVPLIVFQVIGAAVFIPGAFDTPLLLTPGGMAASTFNTVTLLSVLLILFYATESMARDDKARMVPIVRSSGSRLGAMIAARLSANCVIVLGAVLGGVYIGVCIALLVQGIRSGIWIAPSIGPFALVWTFFLVPTVLAWLGFIALSWSITRNRFAVYGLGLGVLMLTGWLFVRDWVNWVFNWHFWNGVRWTDFGPFELDRSAIVMNRVLWITVAVALFAIALRVMQYRIPDPQGATARRRPWPIARQALSVAPFIVVPLILGMTLAVMVRTGAGGGPMRRLQKDYWRKNLHTWRDVKQPFVDGLTVDLELMPATSEFSVSGAYLLRNAEDAPLRRFALTPGIGVKDLSFTFEGTTVKKDAKSTLKPESAIYDSAGLWVFTPATPLEHDETTTVEFAYSGSYPRGIHRTSDGASEFILPSGVVLNSFSPSFLPFIGFIDGGGLESGDEPEARVPMRDEWKQRTRPAFGYGAQTTVTARITLPIEYRANRPGVLVSDEVNGDTHTMTWQTDSPIRFFNVVAGKWVEHKGESTSIWYLPAHERNVPTMSAALDAARKYYSEWFYPYPWKDLRLSEFPGLSSYAQGFGTNIVFSESIGFLSRATEEEDAAFLITAHESAHQWWGNILMPGDGPGGNILSEGMAHYSAARLMNEVRGERARQSFMRQIENSYATSRSPDDERPMVDVDGSRNGDTTIMYDKGGWVFTMMTDAMGREAFDQGLRDFIATFKDGPDYPLLQDFIDLMRNHARDVAAYDAFVNQWFLSVVTPEFGVEHATTTDDGAGNFTTRCTVTNKGTGLVTIEVAATNGKTRWEKADADAEPYRDARTTIALGAGESAEVEIKSDFAPTKIVVDPDVRVLQLRRKQAVEDVTR